MSGEAGSSQLLRLVEVMVRLRRDCPWDAQQTHRSLVTYLVEETGEVVDAIETGDDADLVEELGDLLLQVYFHAQIASGEGRFTLEDVARGISDKLVQRHPHVFGDDEVPADLHATWEARKKAEKGRTSALDGIADSLSVIARTTKVASRTRNHHVPIDLPTEPVTSDEVGTAIVDLVLRAQASGVDADQATRDALRALEARVRAAEA
ncbi:MazG family protein [Aestuariimicrobium kwangyangense]|uniref:MazG family protein n=1 Tax=Aestuariimicrobium kwangyangense TaxID=396389 RepID=UPI0003B6C6E8